MEKNKLQEAELTAPQESQQPEPTEIPLEEADVSLRYEDVYQDFSPDTLSMIRWKNGAYEFICQNGCALRISTPEAGIVRLCYSPDGSFQRDFSYAIDPAYRPAKIRATLHEGDDEYVIATDLLQVVVEKSNLKLRIFDAEDRLMLEDEQGYSAQRSVMRGWRKIRHRFKNPKKAAYMGLGDKACGVNLSGRRFENWCTDAFGFDKDTDPLYRAVPFYYCLHAGAAYGILWDNTFRTVMDFDSDRSGAVELSAEGGEMNLYYLHGPRLDDVAAAYIRLTGPTPLPPMWALGYHQCRWSYYPDERVREVAARFRELAIPCDAIYLDIDYMDGFRCFTWNNEHFPDPRALCADLEAQGFKTVAMIDPGIKEDPDYAVYREGEQNGYFVQSADGYTLKAPVWPGFCAFPDFTAQRVRAWWGTLYKDLYLQIGIAGFWNDMNEPAVFHVRHKTLPQDARHDYDGAPCSHAKAHNVYGQQMSRATWEGLKSLQPERRPFLLSRAGFSGSQRFGAVWTGDNYSDWEHLRIANLQCRQLAISGFSFCGSDVGGFAGTADGELFVRWLQLSVFHPLMRVHSMGQHAAGDTAVVEEAQLADPNWRRNDQEPWSFGEKWTELAKRAIELRYCLLPALYTAMWRHTQSGAPVIRHLIFADEQDPKLLEIERDFLFGQHLLVSPVIQPRQHRQLVYLPKGLWYYFWTGHPYRHEQFVNLMGDQIPIFVREGAVLPLHPVRQHTGEPIEALTLYVYYTPGAEQSELYEDMGEGYGHEHGEYRHTTFETSGSEGRFSLSCTRSGKYRPAYPIVKIYLIGFPTFVGRCTVDGVETPIKEVRLRDRSLYALETGPDFERIEWEKRS